VFLNSPHHLHNYFQFVTIATTKILAHNYRTDHMKLTVEK